MGAAGRTAAVKDESIEMRRQAIGPFPSLGVVVIIEYAAEYLSHNALTC